MVVAPPVMKLQLVNHLRIEVAWEVWCAKLTVEHLTFQGQPQHLNVANETGLNSSIQ